MTNLTRRWSWKKWAPDIGENLETRPEGPLLFLELATGLAGRQTTEAGEVLRKLREVKLAAPDVTGLDEAAAREAFDASIKTWLAAVRAVYIEALGPYVRVAGTPNTVDGLPCNTLDEYLQVLELGADLGVRARSELEAALTRYNSLEGPDELFSRPSSGGVPTTGRTARAR